jgi:hypothetical protein
MKRDKYADIKAHGLFWGGIIFSYFTLSEVDFVTSIIALVVFYFAGWIAGKDSVYKEYEKLHYRVLEKEGRERREADEKLWRETEEYVKDWEKRQGNEK